MYAVLRKERDGVREYKIHTLDEAENLKLEARPWREAVEGGWGITDDGYVAECLARKEYGKSVFMRFSFATAWAHGKKALEFMPFYNTGLYGGSSPRTWLDAEMGRKRFKHTIHALAKMIMSGKVDYTALAQMYRPDQKNPEMTLKRLLRRTEVREKVTQEIDKLLDEEGLTDAWVAEKLKAVVEMAEKGNLTPQGDIKADLTNMMSAIKTVIELRNMKPKTTKMIESAEFDLTHQISGEVEKETKKLTLTREKELPEQSPLEVEDDATE